MRTVVHLMMIQAVTNVVLKEDQREGSIAKFFLNYVEKELVRVKHYEAGRKIREPPPLPQTSDPFGDLKIPSRNNID